MNNLWLAGLGLLLDSVIGDPRWLPHPVVMMGHWIAWVERRLNQPDLRPWNRRLRGCVLALSTVALSTVIPWVVLFGVRRLSPLAADCVNVFLISTTIAWKGLVSAGRDVYRQLVSGDLVRARIEVGKIVGRDTESLSEPEVVRATVETLAENIVDAIVSPLVFGCLGGAPLAFLYRSANTLDSMVGHKNDRYRDFGWCSARLDDVLNYIPARLTTVLLWICFVILRLNPRQAWQVLWRDARKHPSPNSGLPESMVAGALGVQLGGVNYYGGIRSDRATLGQPLRSLTPTDISLTIRVVHLSCWIMVSVCLLGGVLCSHLSNG